MPRFPWLLTTCLVLSTGQQASAQSDEDAVVAAAQSLFEGMQSKDTTMLRGLFLPGARLVSTRPQNGEWVSRTSTLDQFLATVAREGMFLERMWDPEIRIDGPIATVWTPYDFHLDGTFSHCGIDAFQFVKAGDGWRIVSILYTVRPERCETPLGDPQR